MCAYRKITGLKTREGNTALPNTFISSLKLNYLEVDKNGCAQYRIYSAEAEDDIRGSTQATTEARRITWFLDFSIVRCFWE
jgi:hypothetical protein